MTETIEEEQTDVESEASPGRLSLVGGAIGTVVGLRRSKTAAVAGGLFGGAIGYVAGAASRNRRGGGSHVGRTEPVVVTVDETDSTDDAEASGAAGADEHGSDATGDAAEEN